MSVVKRLGYNQRGVTLVELVISVVIISIAMVAILNSFSVSMKYSADPLLRNKSLKLAQLYLDEILAKSFDHLTPVGGIPAVTSPDCSTAYLGPDTGEARATYNDVDDYDGLVYNGPSGTPPLSITGAIHASYSNYSVAISVECDTANRVSASGTSHAKKITVVITPPGEDAMTFAAYKGNF